MSQLVGIIANQRFLGKTNPIMTAAVTDGGSIQDREYIQRAARGIVDAGHWNNLKLWVCTGLPKLRNSGGVDYMPKLYDLSGNSNNGVQTTEANQPSLVAPGMYYDGTDYLDAGNGSGLEPGSGSFTVTFWAKIPNPTATASTVFLSKKNATSLSADPGYDMIYYWASGNGMRFRVADNPYVYRASTRLDGSYVTADTWYLWSFVVSRATNKVIGYLNGSNTNWVAGGGGPTTDDITSMGSISSSNNLYIGVNNSGINFLNATVNDYRIYGAALTATEITAIYNQTSYRYA